MTADESGVTTEAGRALWAQLNAGLFAPLGAGEHSANARAIAAIEAEAQANLSAQLATLREALRWALDHAVPHPSEAWGPYADALDEYRAILKGSDQ